VLEAAALGKEMVYKKLECCRIEDKVCKHNKRRVTLLIFTADTFE